MRIELGRLSPDSIRVLPGGIIYASSPERGILKWNAPLIYFFLPLSFSASCKPPDTQTNTILKWNQVLVLA